MVVAGILTGRVLASGDERRQMPSGPSGPPGSWSLAWGDEFTGEALDRQMWQPNRYGTDVGDAPFNPSKEAAWLSPSSVRVQEGQLVLTLAEDGRTLDGRAYPYRSGVVQAVQPQFAVKPGTYVEARVQVPQCDGCWPAFWLVATDRWPPELDIFEYFGTESDRRPLFNYHPEGETHDEDMSGPASYGEHGSDYRDGFHVYGLLWENSRAIPYLDGTAYPEVAAYDVTSLPLMLILNFAVQYGHEPPAGSEMRVDWVRVWRPTPT